MTGQRGLIDPTAISLDAQLLVMQAREADKAAARQAEDEGDREAGA